MRGTAEPQNIGRQIVGFDTFTGYEGSSERDSGLMRDATVRRDGAMPPGMHERIGNLAAASLQALFQMDFSRILQIEAGTCDRLASGFLDLAIELSDLCLHFLLRSADPAKVERNETGDVAARKASRVSVWTRPPGKNGALITAVRAVGSCPRFLAVDNGYLTGNLIETDRGLSL